MRIIITKKQLIQEGILQGVKDNWGKGLLALGGLAAANAGVFGPRVQQSVETGGHKAEEFLKTAGDWSKGALDKMNAKYGTDTDGDGDKELPGLNNINEPKITPPSEYAGNYTDPDKASEYAGDYKPDESYLDKAMDVFKGND